MDEYAYPEKIFYIISLPPIHTGFTERRIQEILVNRCAFSVHRNLYEVVEYAMYAFKIQLLRIDELRSNKRHIQGKNM